VLSITSMMRTAGALAAAAALLATGAQTAAAAPALVNGSGMAFWTQQGTLLSIKAAGVTYSCTIGQPANVINGSYGNAGSPLQGYVESFRLVYFGFCSTPSGGSGQLYVQQIQRFNAEKSGATFSLSSPLSWKIRIDAGGSVFSTANGPNTVWSAPWVNGNGTYANPSRLVFSNTTVGYSSYTGIPMVVTGTLAVPNVILS
jgi:hypothetical protein